MKTHSTKRQLVILLVLLLLTQLKTAHVYACTPTPTGQAPPTIAERVAAADIVLLGTVTEYIDEPYHDQSAIVQVEQYLKGSGAEAVTIWGFGESSMCRRQVTVDDRLVFYVKQYEDGSLHAHWLTAGEAVAFPSDELIQEVETAVPPTTSSSTSPAEETLLPELVAEIGTPVPPTEETAQPEPMVKTTGNNWLPWSMAGLAILLLGTAVVWYRQYRH